MNFSVESQFISTDVTALKIINDQVYAGIGSFLHVFHIDNGKLLTKKQIFYGQKIHGFALEDDHLAIYGGRQFSVLSLATLDVIIPPKVAQDWILTACWVQNRQLALALAHNVVVLWSQNTEQFLERVTCQEKCILYSALLLGSSWSDLVVFAGTVFSEVVVWSIKESDTEDRPVRHRLKGHKGVIFSLSWDEALSRLFSSSDDRSVRVWRVSLNDGDWAKAEITSEHELYGHVARVWRALPSSGLLVTAGEDSQLVQWDVERGCEVARHENVHQGGNIWSLDIDPQRQLIVTGGGDGGIALWPLGAAPQPKVMSALPSPVRRVAVSAEGRVVAVSQDGRLAWANEDGVWWSEEARMVAGDNERVLLAVSPCRTKFATYTQTYGVTIYVKQGSEVVALSTPECRPQSCVLSLHWPAAHLLLTVELTGARRSLWLCKNDVVTLHGSWLPGDVARDVSAAVLLQQRWLALGGKHGALWLRDIDNDYCLIQKVPRVVPGEAVTSLHFTPPLLRVTGKEGHIRDLQLSSEGRLRACGTEAAQTRLGWLVGSRESRLGPLTLAFHRERLQVHQGQRCVLSIVCGGGHRAWDLAVCGDNLICCFVRDHQLMRVAVKLQQIAPPAIRAGLHWRTVNSALSLPGDLIVSAGDDGGVRILDTSSQQATLLSAHVSSVRALCLVGREDKLTLFSAGGRAQLVAWTLTKSTPVKGELLHSHMLCKPSERCRTPWADTHFRPRPDPETRYMDLCEVPSSDTISVLVACSDTMLRLFSLSDAGVLTLTLMVPVHRCCVLRVAVFGPLTVSTSTDGELAMWRGKLTEQSTWRSRPHQSGINCLALASHGADAMLVSGGDDNRVSLSLISKDAVTTLWSSDQGHAAQVTGAAVLDAAAGLVLTVSMDQRILLWREGQVLGSHVTTVADLQGLVLWDQQSDKCKLCVYGKGFEIFHLSWQSCA